MKYARAFVLFWYDFVVGDDWSVAVGVIIAFVAVGLLAHAGVATWWLLPLAVVVLLSVSLWRAARAAR